MGEHAFIGRRVTDRGAGQQRGLEPAAVLVGAFQVEVGGHRQLVALLEHRIVGDAGVEPDVEDVGDLGVALRVVAEQLLGVQVEPGVDAVLLHPFGHFLDQTRGVRVRLGGGAVHEQGDRHAPGALPGDTPVRAVAQHAFDARLAPLRQPLHLVHLGAGLGQQAALAHGNEPLGGAAENDRRLVAPAVRVAVGDGLQRHQGAALFQGVDHRLVGLAHVQAADHRQVLPEQAVVLHRAVHFQAVLLADDKVVFTVARRGMHAAGTGVGGDVVTKNHRHLAVQERVPQGEVFQGRALERRGPLGAGEREALADGVRQIFGHHQCHGGAVLLTAEQHIIQLRMHRHRPVGGQRPGRGGPDHQGRGCGLDTGAAVEIRRVGDGERHVDGRRLLVLVFHFRFRQGGGAVQAPVHRLEALGQVTTGGDLAERADDVRLGVVVHGQVGVIPVAEHAQPLKVAGLAFHLLGGELPALLAEGGGVHLVAGLAHLLLHLQLDGQPVAVPARHVGGIVAVQGARLDDDVLEDLVHRVADMNVAVGVRGAIVKDELGTSGGRFANPAVQIALLPLVQTLGFALGQTGLHREVGVGKIKRRLVIRHSPSSWSKKACTCSRSRHMAALSSSRPSNFSSGRTK